MASDLPFASSSYQHCGAFGEAASVVTHQQEMNAQAKNNTKPPLSNHPDEGINHMDEIPYKRNMCEESLLKME